MIEEVSIKWAPGAEEKIYKEAPDQIMYAIARTTLDLTYPSIPENTGKMKRSSLAGGVKGSNCDYYIGSYTDYAKYVYVRENNKTHWTTPGTTSHWFKECFTKNNKAILSTVLEENKLK